MKSDALTLSPAQLKQMASSLRIPESAYANNSANTPQNDSEKRRAHRTHLGVSATIIPCGEYANRRPYTVVIQNISETGVAILKPPSLRRGDHFVLRLPSTAPEQDLSAVLCRVAYARMLADGSDVVGAQFTRVLSVPVPLPQIDNATTTDAEREQLRELQQRLLAAHGPKQRH